MRGCPFRKYNTDPSTARQYVSSPVPCDCRGTYAATRMEGYRHFLIERSLPTPMQPTPTSASQARYTAEELQEFETLIQAKLAKAEETLHLDKDSLMRLSSNTTDDTYSSHSGLEDGTAVMEREDLTRSVVRLEKFIGQLKAALGRIRTGDYGVCRATGELIPKERLRLVPHATLTVAAKNQRPEPRPEAVRPAPFPSDGEIE